jgi:beta-lactam-binding protein with PASTA domain
VVKKALEKAGFTGVNLVPAATEAVDDKKDEVLSVTPAEGESAALDEDVTVSYATGMSDVPILTGRVRAQAESDAKAAGFKVKFVTEESDEAAGIVIDQDPKAGERVSRGTTIKLTVAEPKPTPPPASSAPPTSTPPTASTPPSSSTSPPESEPADPPDSTATPGG